MISYRLCPLILRLKQSIRCRETILLEVSPVDKWRRVEKVFLIANTNSAFSETVSFRALLAQAHGETRSIRPVEVFCSTDLKHH